MVNFTKVHLRAVCCALPRRAPASNGLDSLLHLAWDQQIYWKHFWMLSYTSVQCNTYCGLNLDGAIFRELCLTSDKQIKNKNNCGMNMINTPSLQDSNWNNIRDWLYVGLADWKKKLSDISYCCTSYNSPRYQQAENSDCYCTSLKSHVLELNRK